MRYINYYFTCCCNCCCICCCICCNCFSSCCDIDVNRFPSFSCTSRYLATQRSKQTASPFVSSPSLKISKKFYFRKATKVGKLKIPSLEIPIILFHSQLSWISSCQNFIMLLNAIEYFVFDRFKLNKSPKLCKNSVLK